VCACRTNYHVSAVLLESATVASGSQSLLREFRDREISEPHATCEHISRNPMLVGETRAAMAGGCS